jgi:hypothetical protein
VCVCARACTEGEVVYLVAQVAEVVDGAEQLVLQPRVNNLWNGTVLVHGSRVGLKSRREVSEVEGDLLNHKHPHRIAPDDLWSVKLSEERSCKLLNAVVVEVAHERLWQHCVEHAAPGVF